MVLFSSCALAVRLLWREWRGGALGILAAALLLSVTLVTAIGLFGVRVEEALAGEGRRAMAGDQMLSSNRPIPAEWLAQAHALGLSSARVRYFQSMVQYQEGFHLAAVKAVSSSYPLAGVLEVGDKPFGKGRPRSSGPPPGEVWLDSRLSAVLGVALGESLALGSTRLRMGGVLLREPDRRLANFDLGARLLMHEDDLAAAALLQPGSRVRYDYLFGGSAEALGQLRARISPRLAPGQRWVRLEDAQPGVGRNLARAQHFLVLTGAFVMLLAGAAMLSAAHCHARRHLDGVALMRTVGASARRIGAIYGGQLLLLGAACIVLGWLLGWLVQLLGLQLVEMPPEVHEVRPGAAAFLLSGGAGLFCLGMFALPPLLALCRVPPLRVLRRDLGELSVRTGILQGVGALGLLGLVYLYGQSWKLSLILGGVLLGVAVGILPLVLGVWRLARMLPSGLSGPWSLAVARLHRTGGRGAFQAALFALVFALVLVPAMVRLSLLEEWRDQLPPLLPNYFLSNLNAEELPAVERLLREHGVRTEGFAPLLPGRLVQLRGRPLPETALRYTRRDLGFSWAARLPSHNRLVAGSWWEEGEKRPLVSLEEEFAARLEVRPGDELLFRIGERELYARVANIRQLDWNSMRPNFFVLFSPSTLQEHVSTYMTSFHFSSAEGAGEGLLLRLVRGFPALVLYDLEGILQELRSLVGQITQVLSWLMVFLLVAALLVLLAGVQADLQERLFESALLRSLGASRQLVLGSFVAEFLLLGVMAGVLAAITAEGACWLLQEQLLDMNHALHPWLWAVSIFLGGTLLAGIGLFHGYRVVQTPPLRLLRETP